MEKLNLTVLVVLIVLLTGCQEVTRSGINTPDDDRGWLIPVSEVVNGGVPKEGIPSIDNPQFKPTHEIEYVDDHRLIVGVRVGDTIKGYPHQVMDHHEIVNDQIDQLPYSLTYCPLTGTGIAWNREINGETVEFGVSGLLFRNNLIPYDRKTDTHYSQMQMRGVYGSRIAEQLETLQVFQTTWDTWKKMFPEALVLSTETGHNRNYSGYLYGEEYLEEDSPPLFPLSIELEDKIVIPFKKREYMVIDKDDDIDIASTEIYTIEDFGPGVNLEETKIADTDIVVIGSSDLDFAVGFEKQLVDGSTLDFEAVQNSLPIVMEDQEGNQWDVFGYAVQGPRQGERLSPTLSCYGYHFAFGEFFIWN